MAQSSPHSLEYLRQLMQQLGELITDSKNANIEVATYQDMLNLTVTKKTEIKVKADEKKGQADTIYQLWPDGTRKWIAAVND